MERRTAARPTPCSCFKLKAHEGQESGKGRTRHEGRGQGGCHATQARHRLHRQGQGGRTLHQEHGRRRVCLQREEVLRPVQCTLAAPSRLPLMFMRNSKQILWATLPGAGTIILYYFTICMLFTAPGSTSMQNKVERRRVCDCYRRIEGGPC
ncbi:hypothetical protein VPH35_072743 [Triticum aestivum]